MNRDQRPGSLFCIVIWYTDISPQYMEINFRCCVWPVNIGVVTHSKFANCSVYRMKMGQSVIDWQENLIDKLIDKGNPHSSHGTPMASSLYLNATDIWTNWARCSLRSITQLALWLLNLKVLIMWVCRVFVCGGNCSSFIPNCSFAMQCLVRRFYKSTILNKICEHIAPFTLSNLGWIDEI